MLIRRFLSSVFLLAGGFLLLGINGCSSDPHVEGARLDLRNRDYNRGLENITKALERNPENVDALSLKGQILQDMALDMEDPAEHTALILEMLDAYLQSVALDSTQALDVDRRLRVAYVEELQRGMEWYDTKNSDTQNKFENAAMYFQNASRIFPDSTDAYFNEAAAYLTGGMVDRAVSPLQMALQMGDTSRRTYIYLARVYTGLGEMEADLVAKTRIYRSMVRILEDATKIYQDDKEIRNMLLNGYALAGEEEKALREYEMEIAKGDANKLFLYNYGTLLVKLGDYDGAIEQLTKAIEKDSLYVSARYNLGAAYANKASQVKEEYSALGNRLHEEHDVLSSAQKSRIEAQVQSLQEEYQALFLRAIVHLEVARELTDPDSDSMRGICQALYQAYGNTNQISRAEALTTCAAF